MRDGGGARWVRTYSLSATALAFFAPALGFREGGEIVAVKIYPFGFLRGWEARTQSLFVKASSRGAYDGNGGSHA